MDNSRSRPEPRSIAQTLGLDAHTSTKKPRPWRFLIIAGAALIIGLGSLFFGRSSSPQFETAIIAKGPLISTVTATGTLEPLNKVEVGAEISGRIAEVRVDFNDHVKKGDDLAIMDTVELEAAVMESEAGLKSAEASLSQAQASAVEQRAKSERVAKLAKLGNASKQDLDIAQSARARADAGVTQAEGQVQLSKARLVIAQKNLARAHVRSPVDGIVLDRRIEQGQTVAAAFQTPVLFTIAEDLSRMRLHVDVDEADVGSVQGGQRAHFTVDAFPNRKFPAQVLMVRNAPKTDQGVVTYEAVLSVENKDLALKPGMTATAEIVSAEFKDALLVPNGALRFTPPNAPKSVSSHGNVLWVSKLGEPTPVTVETGATDGMRTAIVGGNIKEGTAVLVDVKRKASKPKGSWPR